MCKKLLLKNIVIGTIVVFIVFGNSCMSAPPSQWADISFSGENSQVFGKGLWAFFLENSWEAYDLELIKEMETQAKKAVFVQIDNRRNLIQNFETIEFHSDGSLQSSYIGTSTGGLTGQQINTTRNLESSSWERNELDFKFVLQNGFFYGEGKHNPDANIISGILFSSDGYKRNFIFVYLGSQGISVASTQNDFSTTGNSWQQRGQQITAGNRMIAFTSITGYNGNSIVLRIPSIVNRALVTSIGREAFNNKQITSVIIPDPLNAGRDNRIEHQTVINLITGGDAPDIDAYMGISHIGDFAFANNQITRIIIGENVTISANAFDNMFVQFYENNGRKAGVYTFSDGQWTVAFR